MKLLQKYSCVVFLTSFFSIGYGTEAKVAEASDSLQLVNSCNTAALSKDLIEYQEALNIPAVSIDTVGVALDAQKTMYQYFFHTILPGYAIGSLTGASTSYCVKKILNVLFGKSNVPGVVCLIIQLCAKYKIEQSLQKTLLDGFLKRIEKGESYATGTLGGDAKIVTMKYDNNPEMTKMVANIAAWVGWASQLI